MPAPPGFRPVKSAGAPKGFVPLKEEGTILSRKAEQVTDYVTGESRGAGDYPELSELTVEGLGPKAALGFLTTPDIEARKDIIQKNVPGAEFGTDESGNVVVNLPDGRSAFLNAPGFSKQDFIDLGADIVKFLPAARYAAGGRNILTKGLRGATGAGATAGAEDVAATAAGSEQGFDPGKFAISTIAGGTAEFAAPIVSAIANIFRRRFGRKTRQVIKDGQISRQGRKALERAGINPDEISLDLAESAVRRAEDVGTRSTPTGVAETESGLPLTRGQTTGEFDQLDLEERLRNQGGQAGEIVRNFDRRQRERAIEITDELQSGLAGRQGAIEAEAAGGGMIRERVTQLSEDLLTGIDDAFENAGRSEARLNRESLENISNVKSILDEKGILTDPDLLPATAKAVSKIEELAPTEEVSTRTIQELEATRRVLNELQGASKNRTDQKGVTLLKKRFDEFIDSAFDNALFEGDQQALDLLKKARGLRAEYGRRFQENTRRTRSGKTKADPGGRAIESILERSPSDEEVVNMIFGRSRLFNPENASKTIDALRKATNDSEEVNNVLKQLAFRRIIRPALKDGFSAKRFDTSFKEAMDRSPTVMRKIFTKDELSKIRRFRDDALKTLPDEKIKNPSNTANVLSRTLGSFGQVLGLTKGGIGFGALGGRIGRKVGGTAESRIRARQAEQAVSPNIFLPGRPNDAVISTIVTSPRQAEEQ